MVNSSCDFGSTEVNGELELVAPASVARMWERVRRLIQLWGRCRVHWDCLVWRRGAPRDEAMVDFFFLF